MSRPLHLAATLGDIELAKKLLKLGANVDSRMLDEGTPLLDAVASGHHAMVELLLNHGANILVTDDRDWSVLHWSIFEGLLTTTELLLKWYPDLANKSKFNGIAPPILAGQRNSVALAKILERYGVT